jgi:hypothetical protein
MAKNKQKSNGKQNQTNDSNQPQTAENSNVNESATAQTTQEKNSTMLTLTLKSIQKNGIATYTAEGLNASVYFNKTMFQGEPPQTVSVDASNLTQPGQNVRTGRQADPAKLAEKADKAQQRAQKAMERADKAKARAEQAAKRAGGSAEAPQVEAQPEPVGA